MNVMPRNLITSRKNPHFRAWLSLLDSRGIQRQQHYLLFGKKAVLEQLSEAGATIVGLILSKEYPAFEKLAPSTMQYFLEPSLFAELDIFGTRFPIAVVEQPPLVKVDLEAPPVGLELLLPLGDPSNLGALLRSAWALGVTRVVLLSEAANPFHPKSVRAASGALRRLALSLGPSLRSLSQTKTSFLKTTVTLDQQAPSLYSFRWPTNIRLVIGEEGPGVPHPWPGPRLSIPMRPDCESLNAVAAATIALSHYRQQHPL